MTAPERTAPPQLTEMNNWPSNAYWCESTERVKQYWYVSFCLMMSSAQDRLTGLALRESGNLNWATTAFYYSAVHAGRLVCFVCCGDYPKGHKQLADLLAPTQAREPQRAPRNFHFDWLDEFLRYVRANHSNPQAESAAGQSSAENTRTDRAALVAAINATLPGVRSAFDRFAPLLAKFKNLRNDCNYEALLVAHEVNHFTVTQGFNELVAAADRASGLAVDLAVAAYGEHLRSAECFNVARDQFHAAHAYYLSRRFGHSLDQKFQGSPEAMKELQRLKDLLDWPGTFTDNDVDAFLAPIMYDTFDGKRGLMQRWSDDIRALSGALPTSVPV